MSQKRTILLIEDDIDIQQLIKIALQSRGYKVETANNGLEGLERLKRTTPHLIILDLNMPKMGGVVFYQNICDKSGQPKYPILILTARANMSKLFQELIIDGFKTKPFEIDELLEEIDAIINKKFGGIVKQIKVSGVERPAKVCIVENEQEELNKIGDVFLKAGYAVNSVSSGFDAIEYIYKQVPDVVLVKLSIYDVAGDVLIAQLKRMARTQNVRFILYTDRNTERTVVVDQIGRKYGIDRFVHYTHTHQLLTATNELLRQFFGADPD